MDGAKRRRLAQSLDVKMPNPVTWVKAELKRLNPRWRGLGIMTLGFLTSAAGAAFAVVSFYTFPALGYSDSSMKILFVGIGYVVTIAGAVVMLIGIFWHWFSMFGVSRAKK